MVSLLKSRPTGRSVGLLALALLRVLIIALGALGDVAGLLLDGLTGFGGVFLRGGASLGSTFLGGGACLDRPLLGGGAGFDCPLLGGGAGLCSAFLDLRAGLRATPRGDEDGGDGSDGGTEQADQEELLALSAWLSGPMSSLMTRCVLISCQFAANSAKSAISTPLTSSRLAQP